MASYTTIKVESDGALALITLNRPEKRNAISATMIAELLAALKEVESGSERVAIITGAGKAFCHQWRPSRAALTRSTRPPRPRN